MTNLRACVVPVSLAAAVLAVVPAYGVNTINSVTVGAGQRINSDSAKVIAGNSDYLIMDPGGNRYLWDVKNNRQVSEPTGGYYTSISGNVVGGFIKDETGTNHAYTWTISGGSASATQVGDGTGLAVTGNAGGLVVGAKMYDRTMNYTDPDTQVVSQFTSSIQTAVYNTGGTSDPARVLPQDTGTVLDLGTGAGIDNPIYFSSQAHAVTQHGSTSNYTVGGWQSDINTQKFATIWNVNTSNHNVSSVTLSSNTNSAVTAVSGNLQGGYTTTAGNETATIWRGVAGSELALADGSTTTSDINAVAEAVTTVGGVFDIAVGSIGTTDGDHAALWLIDGTDFRLIELADPTSQSLMYSYATGIGLDADGNLAAIYGFGTSDAGVGQVPLSWTVDGLSTTPVPEPLAAGMLTVGFGAFLLRRPRRTH